MISQEMIIDRSARLVSGCRRVVALTGAGISAESGILPRIVLSLKEIMVKEGGA